MDRGFPNLISSGEIAVKAQFDLLE